MADYPDRTIIFRAAVQVFLGLSVDGTALDDNIIRIVKSDAAGLVYLKAGAYVLAKASTKIAATGLVHDWEMLTGGTVTYAELATIMHGLSEKVADPHYRHKINQSKGRYTFQAMTQLRKNGIGYTKSI
jgi:hypothetical protein